MAHWIIGDVHGCWRTLQHLLSEMKWRPRKDTIWLVGDLVNKGTGSLQVLRWAADHPGCVETVLGNHDVHLLARADGVAKKRVGDTLDPVLKAGDRKALLSWLRSRPFVLKRGSKIVVVHAGLLPAWSLKNACRVAEQCESAMADRRTLKKLYEARRKPWNPDVDSAKQLQAAITIMTTLRVVDRSGAPVFSFDGRLKDAPRRLKAWFDGARSVSKTKLVIFGHWANLGLYDRDGVVCLDTGCVYGGSLSAFRVDDHRLVQVPCAAEDRP